MQPEITKPPTPRKSAPMVKLYQEGQIDQPLTVTGYSLGGHLAGAFNEIYSSLVAATSTFTSYRDQGAYRLKLADNSGADPSVYNATGSTTGKSARAPLTTNLIALRVHSMPANCTKCFKNRAKSSQKAKNCEISKRNRPLAGIDAAQGAIEFAVTTASTQNTNEVQHG
jgi:hypothetical protein